MSDTKFEIDINLLKVSFWMTVILAILKLANVINISNWLVFLPLMIYIGWVVFIIFLIGFITVYLISTKSVEELNDAIEKMNEDEDSDINT